MSDEAKFTQADLDKIKADADSRLEAMDKKVQEALDEAKKAKADLRKHKDIDPADLAKLEEENEKLRADLKTAQTDAKTANTAKEKAEKALADETGFTQKLLIDNGLNAALAEAGVSDPDYLAAAKSLMAGSAQVVPEGTERIVKIGDKTLADHIKAWAGTDGAKKFISAPVNGGGGAPGGKGAGGEGVKQIPKSEYDSTIQSSDAKAIGAMNEGIRKGEIKIVDQAA